MFTRSQPSSLMDTTLAVTCSDCYPSDNARIRYARCASPGTEVSVFPSSVLCHSGFIPSELLIIYRQMEMNVDTLTPDELHELILDYPTLPFGEDVCAPRQMNPSLKDVTATPRWKTHTALLTRGGAAFETNYSGRLYSVRSEVWNGSVLPLNTRMMTRLDDAGESPQPQNQGKWS